ncbi:hypothetical protein BpHYR1_047777 [Brachionus plicatilis]|uniref:Uncharacterized protein n=1 Tax=Brachionus plicatilis TaxID=10195 RepID=A0A3M7T884_BRAPC|nr:hypothetical protein BpHYR1_047777 [Brachionus plicatilis]
MLSCGDMNEITEIANSISLHGVFDETIAEILSNISFESGVSLEFIVAPLISTVSHFMNKSRIRMTLSHSESFIVYTALLANASTGKSPAMRIFSQAAEEIEHKLGIDEAKSMLANGATVEAIIELLKNFAQILSLYDESSSFIGALGRYNNGGTSYDCSIFLQIFNGTTINRDLKVEEHD